MNAAARTPEDRLSRIKDIGRTERLTEAPGHQPDLTRACSPSDKTQQVRPQEGGAPAIGLHDGVVDCRCASCKMSLPLLGQQPPRQSCKLRKHILVLKQDECRNGRDKRTDANQHSGHHLECGATGGPQYEQRDPGDDKGHLGDHTHRGVDNHAGRGLRAGNAAQVRQSRACDVAADIGDRQQRIDRFADPSDPGDTDNVGTGRRRQQLSPRKRGEEHWNDVVGCYRQEPPADDQHGVGHLAGAAVHNQVDDKRKAKETRDDERNGNDPAPPYSAPNAARIDAPLVVSTPVPSRGISQIQCSRVRTAWPRAHQ